MKHTFLAAIAALIISTLIAACGGTNTDAPKATEGTNTVAAFDAAQLQGRWIDAANPKSEIEIKGAEYIIYSEGKELTRDSVEVNTCTGEACTINGNLANAHCMTVREAFGITCYLIVKCTATDLEVSIVGGAGNTQKYKRK